MIYRLHCFCQSGNAFKVASTLELMGVPWEPVFVDFFNGQTRDPAWRASVNAMGEVPVFEDGDLKLSQSGLILLHLAEKHGKFGGNNADEKREILRWVLFDNHKFTSYLATYRFMKAFIAKEPDPGAMAFLKGRADAALGFVEMELAKKPFITGEALTIADLSLSGYLFFPAEEHGYLWSESHPNIAAWLKRIAATPGWRGPYETLPGERINPVR
jgi:glutathione S-transferase